MTVRLYYADSYLREFEAQVVELRTVDGRVAAVLDRTTFYPTSGGQPHDLGTLDGASVIEVVEADEAILHIVSVEVRGRVTGRIDWNRRFDYMQQHTGQHILSQTFLQVLSGQTQSVHFGDKVSTVDVDLSSLPPDGSARVEDLANAIVFEDREVLVREVDEDALPDLGLRRPPKKRGRIRVIEVDKFDRSACGGTHVRRTGEVGPIKIVRWERYKGGIRVEFLCGRRALRDYRWKNAMAVDLAAQFTVKDHEIPDAIARMSAQLKERERALADARERLLGYEAGERIAAASGDPKLIAEVVSARPIDELTSLAGRIVSSARAVVAFASAEGRVVLARSAGVGLDAGELLKRAIEPLGGRGGGRPEFAQGAVPPESVQRAVEAIRAQIERSG